MTIGSELYSDQYFATCINTFRTRNAYIILLSVILLFLSGLSNLLAIKFFDNGTFDFTIGQPHSAIFVILSAIYIVESLVLMLDFLCCRNTMVLLICVIINICSFIVGVYLMVDLNAWDNDCAIFPVIVDVFVIPFLVYVFCKSNSPITDQQQFILLEDNGDNERSVPKYDVNSKSSNSASILADLSERNRLNTVGLNVEEDDSNLITPTSSNINAQCEEDEKAEVLITDTPGDTMADDD